MSVNVYRCGFIVLLVVFFTCYFILTGNTGMPYIVEINEGEGNTQEYGRQIYTSNMRLRAEQYQLRCEEMMLNQDQNEVPIRYGQFIVNDEHKLLYCLIPKVACTNMRRLFITLNTTLNQTDPLKITTQKAIMYYRKYLTRLDSYSTEQIEYRLQNYRKVIFVREPFERILSAFRHKFQEENQTTIRRKYGPQIIMEVRPNASKETLTKNIDVTFEEFVQYLIKTNKDGRGFNPHWATYTNLCSPCQIQYDFVGRFETLDDDVEFLLELIGVSDTIRFPRRNETYLTTKTNDLLYQFYRRISPRNIEILRKIYATDFKLFDYALPKGIMKILRKRDINSVTQETLNGHFMFQNKSDKV